jgi:beta-glucosidase-like glycosyl hydrolase
VASIDELIGMSQDAALKGGEARAALLDAGNQMAVAQGSIEEAISVIAQIQGQATSALLESYRAILAQVQTDIASLMEQNESIIEAIGAGQERGEEFNGRLLG